MLKKNSFPYLIIGLLSVAALLIVALIVRDLGDTGAIETALYTISETSEPQAGSASSPVPADGLEDRTSDRPETETNGHHPFPAQATFPAEGPDPSLNQGPDLYKKAAQLLNQMRDDEAAAVLRKIIEDDPDDLKAYSMLGELYYKNDRLSEAITVWERILAADPLDENVKARIAKARREDRAHQEFIHKATRHFRIKFQGSENRDLYKTVLELLEDAYAEVGKALSFYPDSEVIVLLYTNQQFFDITRVPSWTGGLFDGKIRIPAGGYQKDVKRLKRVLYHEYTHAAIHQMTLKNRSGAEGHKESRVPTWLHEGIAQYLEPDLPRKEMDRSLKEWARKGNILKLSDLHGSFLGLNETLADQAYAQSLSAVTFLVDQFGSYSLQRLLAALARNRTMDEAMRDAIFASYADFQSMWERHVRS